MWSVPALHGFRHQIHHQSSSVIEVRCNLLFLLVIFPTYHYHYFDEFFKCWFYMRY